MILFCDENAAMAVINRRGNAAVARGEHGEAGGHRFQHRIGNAFLVAVAANTARMKKHVRLVVKLAELILVQETWERHLVFDVQFIGQLLQILQQRSFPSDHQSGIRENLRELGKCAERSGHSLFFDKPSGLRELPSAIGRNRAWPERKLIQRYSRSNNTDFVRVISELD